MRNAVLGAVVALALCACSGKTGETSEATDDHPEKAACDAYVALFETCMGRLSKQPFNTEPVRDALAKAAEDVGKRAELRDQCTAQRAQLQASCR